MPWVLFLGPVSGRRLASTARRSRCCMPRRSTGMRRWVPPVRVCICACVLERREVPYQGAWNSSLKRVYHPPTSHTQTYQPASAHCSLVSV